MKDLLLWLQSGQKYLRLEDGSYVAPSEDFKKNLRILEDMGADSERDLGQPALHWPSSDDEQYDCTQSCGCLLRGR